MYVFIDAAYSPPARRPATRAAPKEAKEGEEERRSSGTEVYIYRKVPHTE